MIFVQDPLITVSECAVNACIMNVFVMQCEIEALPSLQRLFLSFNLITRSVHL